MLQCSPLPYLYDQSQWLSDGVFVTSKWDNASEMLRQRKHLTPQYLWLVLTYFSFWKDQVQLALYFFSKRLPSPFVNGAKVYCIVSGVGGQYRKHENHRSWDLDQISLSLSPSLLCMCSHIHTYAWTHTCTHRHSAIHSAIHLEEVLFFTWL